MYVINVGFELIICYIYYYFLVFFSCDFNGLKCFFILDEFVDLNGMYYNDSIFFFEIEYIFNFIGNGMESFGIYLL